MALGMALVVAIMAILVTGALKGLQGYRSAMKTVESKLEELNKAGAFKLAAMELRFSGTKWPEAVRPGKIQERLNSEVCVKLNEYKQALDQTIALGRAEDSGFKELHQYEACAEAIVKLNRAIDDDNKPRMNSPFKDDLMDDERPPGQAAVYLI